MINHGSRSPGLGANVIDGGVHFAVWAPKAGQVEVELHVEGRVEHHSLARDADGTYAGVVSGAQAGDRYRFRLDGDQAYPDPYSRFQPEGVHGPSEIVDPSDFAWSDQDWSGLTMDGLVIYECHVGTFTAAGTFAALERELPELKRLGVSAVELMPIAEFPGRWNWGYDGVNLFAPSRAYGRPDDLRRFVEAAHREGLGVILDVVYNHFGPDGNYLRAFSDEYFTDRHQTPWGDALNYDGPNSRWMRSLVRDNIRAWIRENHIDGFRLDATHAILDDSPSHILAEIADQAHAATDRGVVVIAEDERNDVRLIQSRSSGGFGLDAVWADDIHHELRVFLTNTREGYFAGFQGTMAGASRAINEGFIYQGQASPNTCEARGTPVTDEPATGFVFCIQNHDQIGNRPFGDRLHHEINLDQYAVASTLLLFAPETPLLFMGQEFAASTPFLYFTDHEPELGRLVTEGRRQEFSGFRAFADEDLRDSIPDPQVEATFFSSKLNLAERQQSRGIYDLYRELLRLRREDPVLSRSDRSQTKATALGARTIAVHRWRDNEHRLLIANFGFATGISFADIPDLPDLPIGGWRILLSTARRRFGGSGGRAVARGRGRERRIDVTARSAVILCRDA